MRQCIVALDGPAGSGKSSIAKKIAEKYHLTYLDTGAMYRMIALYFLEKEIAPEEEEKVRKALSEVKLDMRGGRFFLNGMDVSEEIRSPRVSAVVSEVAALKLVRDKLVDLQREISLGKAVILDGRDIGTVVFPKADLKIYLLASPEERARRRYKEYQEKKIEISYEEVLQSIEERDYLDSHRKESPLKKAEDAVEVDSTYLSLEQVLAKISKLLEDKGIGATDV